MTIVLLLERRIWRKLTLTWRGNEATTTARLPRREGPIDFEYRLSHFPKVVSVAMPLCVI